MEKGELPSFSEPLMTKKELADFLRVSEQTINRLISEQPDFPALRVGSQWRFEREKVIEFFRLQRGNSKKPKKPRSFKTLNFG